MSASRAIDAHIGNMERMADVEIPSDMGYIVSMMFTTPNVKVARDFVQNALEEGKAVCGYAYPTQVSLVFFRDDTRDTQTSSSLISSYVTKLTMMVAKNAKKIQSDFNVVAKIVLIDGRLKAFSYLLRTMFENAKSTIFRILQKDMRREDLVKLSYGELMKRLEDHGYDWKTVPFIEKWGVFLRKGMPDIEVLLNFSDAEEQMIILFESS